MTINEITINSLPEFELWHLLLLCLGGSAGALLRYGVTQAGLSLSQRWPWSTWLVNVTGAFLLGACTAIWNNESFTLAFYFWELGVLGAFTTFATFSLESLQLIRQKRWLSAAFYMLSSVLFSILALLFGYQVGALLS